MKTCPNCKAKVTSLIRDAESKKTTCHNCDSEGSEKGIGLVSKKLHEHSVAGTLDKYPIEERLKDLKS